MNLLVFSDTHGEIGRAVEMYERMAAVCRIDHLIHCGDLLPDARALEQTLGIAMTAVPGNCDGIRDRRLAFVETPAGRILVTHGHTENVKFSLHELRALARQEGCRIACFGHTHVAVNKEIRGIRLLNPGSLTQPRDRSSGTCALLIAEEKACAASILQY